MFKLFGPCRQDTHFAYPLLLSSFRQVLIGTFAMGLLLQNGRTSHPIVGHMLAFGAPFKDCGHWFPYFWGGVEANLTGNNFSLWPAHVNHDQDVGLMFRILL